MLAVLEKLMAPQQPIRPVGVSPRRLSALKSLRARYESAYQAIEEEHGAHAKLLATSEIGTEYLPVFQREVRLTREIVIDVTFVSAVAELLIKKGIKIDSEFGVESAAAIAASRHRVFELARANYLEKHLGSVLSGERCWEHGNCQELHRLKERLERLDKRVGLRQEYPVLHKNFLRSTMSLDLKVDDRRTISCPVPRFMPFSLKSPYAGWQGEENIIILSFNVNNQCDGHLREFADVIKNPLVIEKPLTAQKRRFPEFNSLTLLCRFSGLIPEHIKQKIREARQDFGEKIFIIAETHPSDWSLEESLPPPRVDPLVVGIYNNVFYLIADFDTTELEQFVKNEFALRPLA